jgi:uncharacterized protein YecT (DUF1311 family)
MIILAAAMAATAVPSDLTYTRLRQCLASEGGSSTGGETLCYEISRRAYQARTILALSALQRRLDGEARTALDIEQKAWIAYRDARREAMLAMLSTRTGSMYAPMQEADDMTVARDRALRLEAQLHILEIEP